MNNMEIMTKWVSRQVEQSSKFRKWSHLTVMQPLKPGKHSTSGISQYNDSQNQDLSTVWLVCMHYVWECIRVSVWGCPVQLLSDPSFLLFSNPSCMGQRTERASIWAPSPAYLLDTQVGNDSSGPLLPPPPPFFLYVFPPCWLRTLCVCNMAWLSLWNTSFSLVGALHANSIVLLCVVCPYLGCWGLGPFIWACVPRTIPYIMLWLCKIGLSVDLCVSLCTLLAFIYSFLFLGWGCTTMLKLYITSPCIFLLKHNFRG